MKDTLELKLIDFLSLNKSFPNDIEFGKNCRPLFETPEVNKLFPNDHDLGIYLRKYLKEIQK